MPELKPGSPVISRWSQSSTDDLRLDLPPPDLSIDPRNLQTIADTNSKCSILLSPQLTLVVDYPARALSFNRINNLWVFLFTANKNRFMYSKKWNCAARSWDICRNRSQIHDCRNWEQGRRISGNICFEFSVQCVCSVVNLVLSWS